MKENDIKKFKAYQTPNGCYLIKPKQNKDSSQEYCIGYYDSGKREKSLDGFYFKQDLRRL